MSKSSHNCNGGHGPVFGRKTAGCPRCDELLAGAAPVKWAASRASQDAQRCKEIAAHFSGHRHQSGQCGPVCTFGEW
jgi:hypothetical protein